MLSNDQTAELKTGDKYRGKTIREVIRLSNGEYLIKTDDSKSPRDFKVKLVLRLHPTRKSITPKHAHFAIDLYGKLSANRDRGVSLFSAIVEVWQGRDIPGIVAKYLNSASGLPGYNLEYILNALSWILEQEDINFNGRPKEKQKELDSLLARLNVAVPAGRLGSELAMSLLCSIVLGEHPVQAFIKANLDVLPVKRARGAV